MSDALLKIAGVSKTFVSQNMTVPALGPIDLEVRDGEFVCIVGGSGSGKTTFLNVVAGLEKPDAGDVIFAGAPVRGPGPDRLVLFQELGLYPWLSVLENVEFGLRLKGLSRTERRRASIEHLEMVQLSEFRNARVHELSGGMKQRAALARALVMDPKMLLMDEPFGALDAQTRDMLHLEIQELWARTRKTIFFVTHNVNEAVCLGDRVVTFTRRPGRVKNEFPIDLPRPRVIEDPAVSALAAGVREDLREEMDDE